MWDGLNKRINFDLRIVIFFSILSVMGFLIGSF